MEQWQDITGYEGRYRVSSYGRVASRFKVLQCGKGNHGFNTITLLKDGKRRTFLVHRLVAIAFIPNVNGYTDVDHKNFDKTDNRIENLEWVSDSINNKRLFNSGRGGGHYQSAGRVRCIETGLEFPSMLALSKLMGFPYASVNYHCRGQMGMTDLDGLHFEFVENNA